MKASMMRQHAVATRLSGICSIGIFTMVLLVAGCSPQSSESAIQTAVAGTQAVQPTSTPIPPTATITATATITSTPTPTFTPTPKPITLAQIQPALLALEDLPSGWAAKPADAASEEKGDTFTFLCQTFPRKSRGQVETEFIQGQIGPFLNHSIAIYSAGDAKEVFKDLSAAIEACPVFVPANDTEKTEWTVSRISFIKLGDDSFALRSSATFMLGFIEADSIYFRIGNSISSIQYMQVGLDAIDHTAVEKLAVLAEQKLQEAIR